LLPLDYNGQSVSADDLSRRQSKEKIVRRDRLKTLILYVVAGALLICETASAIELSIIGSDAITVDRGEMFSIDLALDNASETSTNGVEVRLFGMTAAGASVTSGRTAVSHFVEICTSTSCLGGLNTIRNAFFNPDDLSENPTRERDENGVLGPGTDSMLVVVALFPLSFTQQSGVLDPGLDNGATSPSHRDVSISLIANTIGIHILTFETEFSTSIDGAFPIVVSGPERTFTVTVVPEPGVGTMIGLGLAGLAMGRRQRR